MKPTSMIGLPFTYTAAGRTWTGAVHRAEQRCAAVVGIEHSDDDDEGTVVRCRMTRAADAEGPWPCGHDSAEGVIHLLAANGDAGEMVLDVGALVDLITTR